MSNVFQLVYRDNPYYEQLSFNDMAESREHLLNADKTYFDFIFNKLKNKGITLNETIKVFRETDHIDISLIQLTLNKKSTSVKAEALDQLVSDSLIITDYQGRVLSLVIPVHSSTVNDYINESTSGLDVLEPLTAEYKFRRMKKFIAKVASDLETYSEKCTINELDKLEEIVDTLNSIHTNLK